MSSPGLHPRNKHSGRYNFKKLIEFSPELGTFVAPSPYNELTIDFASSSAVRALNRALLKSYYGLKYWEIPSDFLCPPIPGRSDYVHNAADLLSLYNQGEIPYGPQIRILDIGVGASCIYPIIGNREYGWSFLGTDIDPTAIASAKLIVASNVELSNAIEIRKQPQAGKVFDGVNLSNENFDLTLCNPPFHSSLQDAQEGSARKWKNLGKSPKLGDRAKNSTRAPNLNFGGKGAELWCPGGEIAFIGQIIRESAELGSSIFWFTTLVSKKDSLASIYRLLKQEGACETRTIEMSQGQKKSRMVAWSYLSPSERKLWRETRWMGAKSQLRQKPDRAGSK